MTKFRQGKYIPKNPSKYKGDVSNIVYRSSWERIVFNYLDNSVNCMGWASEETIIPYRSPVDDKVHRYFVDVKATFSFPDGSSKTYLIEIKPHAQTLPPKPSRNKKVLMESQATYAVNQAKWDAAMKFCRLSGWEFKILTEYDIGIKSKPPLKRV